MNNPNDLTVSKLGASAELCSFVVDLPDGRMAIPGSIACEHPQMQKALKASPDFWSFNEFLDAWVFIALSVGDRNQRSTQETVA